MSQTSRYFDLIAGRRRGPTASLQRGLLWGLSLPYGAILALRNFYYDGLCLPRQLDVPVISVGNITVGGTGKTPMTLWVSRQLLQRGRKPAILSRGYKASQEGLADELLMISRQCPQAVAVANPDRWAAGQLAIQEYDVRGAVLDDGFQHRRLDRDLDIVLIDATQPFGFGHILPRGLLRESLRSLARADAFVLTRCDQAEPAEIEAVERTLRARNKYAPIVRAVHRPTGFADLNGQLIENPPAADLGAFAGIARPESFARTLEAMQRAPARTRWFPDHHIYTAADVDALSHWAREHNLAALVTTEKDAVKLAHLGRDWPIPVATLRIEIEFLDDGDKILAELIDDVLADFMDDEVVPVSDTEVLPENDESPTPDE